MARHPNPDLPAAGELYVGASGSGKSHRLRHNPRVAQADRIIAWDPDEDLASRTLGRVKVIGCDTLGTFRAQLRAAVLSGKRYRLAYTGPDTPATFEAWAAMVWAVADGSRPIVVTMEELADVTRYGKAEGALGRIVRKGRKYGLAAHYVSQRANEIPRTVRSQAAVLHVGVQAPEDRPQAAELLGVDADTVAALKPREWIELRRPAELILPARLDRSRRPSTTRRPAPAKAAPAD